MNNKTTEQAAIELGVSRPALIAFISRHPHLRPSTQLHKAALFLWTDEEIEAVREAKANIRDRQPKKVGRPTKQ